MITVCGEALVDLVSTDGRQFTAHPGGSPANVAVGLSRLDVPVSLLGRVAGDSFGRMLAAHLRCNGVSERDLVPAAEPTTLAVATLAGDGAAAYEFYVQGTADWQWRAGELPERLPDDVAALHAGSLALALPPGATHLEALLRRERDRGAVTVSLDPNVRPALFGPREEAVARVERQVRLADVVKVSAEDLGWLYGRVAVREVAGEWLALGPSLVVVTLGDAGAVALGRAAGEVVLPPVPVEVVDTVGAGDAFTAGLLAALHDDGLLGGAARPRLGALDGAAVASLLRRAGQVAALTCTRRGADPPTRSEIDRRGAR